MKVKNFLKLSFGMLGSALTGVNIHQFLLAVSIPGMNLLLIGSFFLLVEIVILGLCYSSYLKIKRKHVLTGEEEL